MKQPIFFIITIMCLLSIASCKMEKPDPNTTITKAADVKREQIEKRKSFKDKFKKRGPTSELSEAQEKIDQMYANGNYVIRWAWNSIHKKDMSKYDPSLKTMEDVVEHLKNSENAKNLYQFHKNSLPEDQQKYFFPVEKFLKEIAKCKDSETYLAEIRKLEKALKNRKP